MSNIENAQIESTMRGMAEREKVIRGLEICVQCRSPKDCDGCPYEGERTYAVPCGHVLMADALALLREQDEGVTPIESTIEQKKFADRIGFAVSEFWCGACRFNLVGHPKFCPNCGKKVKWDD